MSLAPHVYYEGAWLPLPIAIVSSFLFLPVIAIASNHQEHRNSNERISKTTGTVVLLTSLPPPTPPASAAAWQTHRALRRATRRSPFSTRFIDKRHTHNQEKKAQETTQTPSTCTDQRYSGLLFLRLFIILVWWSSLGASTANPCQPSRATLLVPALPALPALVLLVVSPGGSS
ncbi:hypothetical protein NLG97_g10481 [Lecanicillium saksenae]|uniref:Uncharacterized protein n=1 Tax=Lecanicillium saksenae TaxID=468837 RepID=A0ACC1QGX8_9HYPO|nr:hypothetical protein NLG97_g10481 [Lecanicillium saksenae]